MWGTGLIRSHQIGYILLRNANKAENRSDLETQKETSIEIQKNTVCDLKIGRVHVSTKFFFFFFFFLSKADLNCFLVRFSGY